MRCQRPSDEADPSTEIIINVETRTVSAPSLGISAEFPLDDFTRFRLLEGLDDIGLTLRHEADITAYEQTRPSWMPVTTNASPVKNPPTSANSGQSTPRQTMFPGPL